MVDRKKYGSSYIPDCPLCQGTNGGHYQTCPSYGGEKADERGSAEPPDTKEMRAVGALLSAMHDLGLDGRKVREAMQWALHPDSAQARDAAQAASVELLDRACASIAAFVSDEGWEQSDMDTLDALVAERAVLAKNGLGGKQ